jgi:hypothetical protein
MCLSQRGDAVVSFLPHTQTVSLKTRQLASPRLAKRILGKLSAPSTLLQILESRRLEAEDLYLS